MQSPCETDKAIADFNAALRLDPKNAASYYYRSLAWSKKGETDKSLDDYGEAVRLDPNYGFATDGKLKNVRSEAGSFEQQVLRKIERSP